MALYKCTLAGRQIMPFDTHNTIGDRSFVAAGPHVWNSLPAHLHDKHITYGSFRYELLKTYWF